MSCVLTIEWKFLVSHLFLSVLYVWCACTCIYVCIRTFMQFMHVQVHMHMCACEIEVNTGFLQFFSVLCMETGPLAESSACFFSASQERQLLWEFPVPAFHASCMGSGYSNVNPHIVGHALLSQVPTPKIFQILSRHWNQCHFRSSLHIIRKCLKYNFQPGLSGMHLLF